MIQPQYLFVEVLQCRKSEEEDAKLNRNTFSFSQEYPYLSMQGKKDKNKLENY